MKNTFYRNVILLTCWINIFILLPSSKAAENLIFVNGLFSRTVTIDSLEKLATTGKPNKKLKNLLRLSNQSPKELADLLNENFELPLVVTSKLMYSSIGQVLLLRISKIIYPKKLPDQKISIPAIRSGVIQGIVVGNGKLNLIKFFKSYPNKIITINMPALFKVLNKVESTSELIEFFSDSPLKGIRKGETRS